MAAVQASSAEIGDARLREAWSELRGDGAVQFDLTQAPSPPQPPQWLRTLGEWVSDFFAPVGRALEWISSFMPDAPYARILLWTVLAAAFVALVWLLVQRLRTGEWRLNWRWRKPADEQAGGEETWTPEAGPARAWLEEADRLAERGEYAAAAHHLLLRSIEDIQWRKPRLVRPALTSRDLAAAREIPPPARSVFAQIVATVERSLFGGRGVSADEWQAARAAYADFALARSWKA